MADSDHQAGELGRTTDRCNGAESAELLHRYRMICRLGQMVTSEMNLDSLFDLIIDQTNGFMDSERASIFLYNPEDGQLWSWASTDLKKNAICISPDCGVAGWVFRSVQPAIINDPYNDPRFFSGVDRKTGFRTRNILCIPLITRDQTCIGTLQALNKKSGDFDEQDLELLTTASHYMTIALENARLYEELKVLDRAKERAIHHLSHEIKTPLTIISGVLSQIRSKLAAGSTDGLEKTLMRGQRNVRRLISLQHKIEDILQCQAFGADSSPDVHRLALEMLVEIIDEKSGLYPQIRQEIEERMHSLSREDPFSREVVVLNDFLNGVCNRALAAAGGRELCMIRNFEEGVEIHTNRHVLEKVCNGLLKNAIENTPDEGTVEVSIEKREKERLIVFTDHGVGITPGNQELLFSGFFPTQPTVLYSSKKPYEFNAGGAGADLLRIKSFAKQLGFRVAFKSRRCPVLPRDEDFCPGRISACGSIHSKEECLAGSGSTFIVCFSEDALQRKIEN